MQKPRLFLCLLWASENSGCRKPGLRETSVSGNPLGSGPDPGVIRRSDWGYRGFPGTRLPRLSEKPHERANLSTIRRLIAT